MKRVLIITHNFPPTFNSGVLRPLKFAKYLPQFGWQPYILTTLEPARTARDYSLLDQFPPTGRVYRTASLEVPVARTWMCLKKRAEQREPRGARTFTATEIQSPPLARRIIDSVYASLPLDPQISWIPFAVRKGREIVLKEHIDVICASGPPFTCFAIGYLLKKLTKRPLVLDYRDPWTQQGIYPFMQRRHNFKIDSFLERRILEMADHIIVAHPNLLSDLPRKYPSVCVGKITAITNGYDPADFEGLVPQPNAQFTIVYTGTFYFNYAPDSFLRGLRRLLDEDPDLGTRLRVIFTTVSMEDAAFRRIVGKLALDHVVHTTGFVPYRQSLQAMINADLLLLVLPPARGSHGWIPGKLFDYLYANRPILAIVPEGSAAEIIGRTSPGFVIHPNDVKGIAKAIREAYSRESRVPSWFRSNRERIAQFDRRVLTAQLASLLNGISGSSPDELRLDGQYS